MSRYLQSILVFDVAFPAIMLGIPGLLLLCAFFSFQQFVAVRTTDYREHQDRVRQVAILEAQTKDVLARAPLLKAILSGNDVDARLDRATQAAAEKYSSDEIERTLCDFQSGPSAIGSSYGIGRRVQLKFFSRWEPLNAAALDWESANPNLVLETLSIDRAPTGTDLSPSLESSFSYFIISEN
jgi:hypothetical protein